MRRSSTGWILALALSLSACNGARRPVPGLVVAPGEMISPGGKWTYKVSDDRLTIRKASTGEHVMTLPHRGRFMPAMFGPRDESVVVVDPAGFVYACRVPDGTVVLAFERTRSAGAKLAVWSPKNHILLCWSHRFSIHDPATGRVIASSLPPRNTRVQIADVVLNRDGSRLLTIGEDGRMSLWETVKGSHLACLEGGRLPHVAFTPNRRWILRYGDGGKQARTEVYDLGGSEKNAGRPLYPVCYTLSPEGRPLAEIDGHGLRFLEAAFTDDRFGGAPDSTRRGTLSR
jgi:WD40 repeat protein